MGVVTEAKIPSWKALFTFRVDFRVDVGFLVWPNPTSFPISAEKLVSAKDTPFQDFWFFKNKCKNISRKYCYGKLETIPFVLFCLL